MSVHSRAQPALFSRSLHLSRAGAFTLEAYLSWRGTFLALIVSALPRMSTPQRTEKPVRLNLTQRLAAAEAKIVENPTFHGEKMKGRWLITPVGNFKLRGRGGSDTNAAVLQMLDLLEGKDPGTVFVR
jgi:hypothetical protein